MVKNLENVHQQLMDIARESNRLSHTKYTADDVEKLQNKLRSIDSQYNEGAFCCEMTSAEGRYEEEGQAQVVHELEKIHNTLYHMLSRID
jgi:hypothetical protein